jgi:BirA family biotin operon repressor/biotin-[acetyl-CoA-carboxylase] ligase
MIDKYPSCFLNMAISLGVFDFVRSMINEFPVTIKWPNDIYILNQKTGGILINHSISGRDILFSVIGIGININQEIFLSDAPNPTSFKRITGREFDLKHTLNVLLGCLDFRYHQLFSGQFAGIRSDYIGALLGYFKWMKFIYKQKMISARITGVSPSGLLQLEKHDYSKFECDLKEVEFIV